MKNFFQDKIVAEDISNISIALLKIAKALEGKTMLITGGSGFLGSYMVGTILSLNKIILKEPCKIISVDNYITSSKKSKKKIPFLTNIDHDISRPLHIKEPVDYIIHAAGIASPIYYKQYPLEAIDVAVNGTRNILELAHRRAPKSILYFSSSEIYGDPTADQIPIKETYRGNVSSIGPRACYDESKRLGETLCMTYFDLYKIPVKIVRPFNIYGPGMKMNDYRIMPNLISKYLQKKKNLPIFGKGTQTRAFCYISDAIEGFFRVLLSKKHGEIYNVGNYEREITMRDLAKLMNKLFENKLKIKKTTYPNDYPKDEPRRRSPDITKIKNNLGYRPKIALKKGLMRTITWCKDNWSVV